MVDRYSFHLDNAAGADPLEVLEGFCIEYYGTAPSLPPQVLVPRGLGDLVDARRRSSRSCAARASRCARPSAARSAGCRSSPSATPSSRSRREPSSPRRRRLARVEALEELREVLNLESLPLRIECFDISNIQGQEIVGSMVVFEDGVARKAHYRKFAIRGQEGQDDFAAMAELVGAPFRPSAARRGRRGLRRVVRRRRPNLVVIDGGKGQLGAALAAMEALRPAARRGDRPRQARRGGVPSRPARSPVLLPDHSPGLRLLQRVRDEAHRFAVSFHRTRRDRSLARLDVRPARRRRPGPAPRRSCATSARPSEC